MKRDRKRKHYGLKDRVREEKDKEYRIGLAVTVAILIFIILAFGFFVNLLLSPSPQKQETSFTSEPKAAIVDQLSLTAPNQIFIETATHILKQAGYTVDYYPGEEVTVEFYRNLPTSDHRIIVLRAHSAIPHHQSANPTRLAIFTSEPYSKTKYVYEQLNGRLGRVVYYEGSPDYFGIGPDFVKSSMNGKFNDAVIIMMGCEGLTYQQMAEAFADKGAKACISWNGMVSASHTDQTTTLLLQHLVLEKQTVKQAIDNTTKTIGADPTYQSLPIYYPLEAANYNIDNIIDLNS